MKLRVSRFSQRFDLDALIRDFERHSARQSRNSACYFAGEKSTEMRECRLAIKATSAPSDLDFNCAKSRRNDFFALLLWRAAFSAPPFYGFSLVDPNKPPVPRNICSTEFAFAFHARVRTRVRNKLRARFVLVWGSFSRGVIMNYQILNLRRSTCPRLPWRPRSHPRGIELSVALRLLLAQGTSTLSGGRLMNI